MATVPVDVLAHRAAFAVPRRLTAVTNWHHHIPFAFFTMQLLRPRLFVELGTHRGDSYCAFCQAADEMQLGTSCYAIDTWRGDEQAGHYDEAVFAELSAYHDRLYGRFSRLVRSTFDEAVAHFPDGQIDLLHIDGLHTYEAAMHDFETWLPKLSSRAIVLFHDIVARERGFGVWRVWQELARRYPARELRFGHGLGVLAVGTALPADAAALFDLDRTVWESLEALFFALGSRTALLGAELRLSRAAAERERLLAEDTGRIAELRARLLDSEAEVGRLKREIEARGSMTYPSPPSWRRRPLVMRQSARIRHSALFEPAWYLAQNPDVARARVDAARHYLLHGAAEGRDPGPHFDTRRYLAENPAVARTGENPLLHFILRRGRGDDH